VSISGKLGCAPRRLYLVEDLEPFYAETELFPLTMYVALVCTA
jgi:hypothetical protein